MHDRLGGAVTHARKVRMRKSQLFSTVAVVFTTLHIAVVPTSAQRGGSDNELRFTVASLKPLAPLPQPAAGAAPPGEEIISERVELTPAGGSANPGVVNPGRIHRAATLKELLAEAYDVKEFQIDGPDWIGRDRFLVDATMPPDTTSGQVLAMMRNLLADRFQLTSHRETKELPLYGLVVGKGGPRLKESSETSPSGVTNVQTVSTAGSVQITARNATMQDLANHLTRRLERPMRDETGLQGQYDFVLTFDDGLSAYAAVQAQLGLKIEARKGPVEMIVLDHVERIPVEN
jgi:uncharacterized protein (TIGR03435 family)